MRAFFKKHQQIFAYLFWGVATTAVDYTTYFLLTRLFSVNIVPANISAWATSVLFAYWSNRTFVFHGTGNPIPEFLIFAGGRVLSGALETGILWLFVQQYHWHDGITKVIASAVVVSLNYLFSKFIIFKKRGN